MGGVVVVVQYIVVLESVVRRVQFEVKLKVRKSRICGMALWLWWVEY